MKTAKKPESMSCLRCKGVFKLHELTPNPANKWGVAQRCKPCDSAVQAEYRKTSAQREAEAARRDAEMRQSRRDDPRWAGPRTVIGEGTYTPQPWVVREGALAYRLVPSRGIGG